MAGRAVPGTHNGDRAGAVEALLRRGRGFRYRYPLTSARYTLLTIFHPSLVRFSTR